MAILVTTEVQTNISNFSVVGIGVSSGALDVLKKLLSDIPQNSGIAYIIVRHTLDFPTNLSEILSPHTQIPVNEIINEVNLEADHIYIMPENNVLIELNGVLKLKCSTRNERQNNSIDLFFESLAAVYKSALTGLMLLSDSNFESVRGFKKVKENGGIAIIQNPKKAVFRGITQHMRDIYMADYVMTTDNFPFELLQIQQKYLIDFDKEEENISPNEKELLTHIIELISLNTGHDFSNYKEANLRRRIAIRMAVLQKSNLESYHSLLLHNKSEQETLFNDFLIAVSYFFNDSNYFENLTNIVFPYLISNAVNDTLRIWVVGCATGEETYSLAICLHEYLLKNNHSVIKVQIFASDLSEKAIIKARAGIYSNFDVQQIAKERLQNYFVKNNREYRVGKIIRDMCVFAVHNFVKDPPFAKMDFINCHNVLKYFNPFLQNKALVSFFYSLNDKGILFLGKSETVNHADDIFENLEKEETLYIRKGIPGQNVSETLLAVQNNSPEKVSEFSKKKKTDFQKIVSDLLFLQYTPVCVVIDENMEIVYFHGDTSPFLSPSQGKPSFNILKMTEDEVGVQLQDAIVKAKAQKINIRKENIETEKKSVIISFEIVVLENDDQHLIIIFYKEAAENKKLNNFFQKDKIGQAITGERPITVADSDYTPFPVQEILKTKDQELASTKEELSCINDELKESQKELIRALDYGAAVINTVHEPLLIMDSYFFIKSANPAFYQCFKTTETEIEDHSFFEIGNCQWNIPEFKEQISKILDNQQVIERSKVEVVCDGIGKKTMLINARLIPISNEMHILVTFDDITELVIADEQLMVKKLEIQKYNYQLEAFTTAASDVLHEPLRKVHMFSKRTFDNENNLSDLGRHYLERIQYLISNMSQLIDDVINYSSVIFQEREYKKTDLNMLLKKIIRDLKDIITQKNAKISVAHLPVLNIIPQQIQQLFSNLVINSIIFSKEEEDPRIKIESQSASSEEIIELEGDLALDYVKICVIDNGIGFEKEYEIKVFEPFYRLHHDNQYKGSGLGLTLAKKIVANHQGFIKVSSEKNAGTTMMIFIPLLN